ncbi:hypothetical protein SY85_13570 [Flavisolibacter tropicus]|uniref:Uncharacterized protein n=2 Tax=Flavisolibacter tropicus TaxID=1492898 RepID=A0A172TX77_9BACT|nr:hypothetical protein SY85_13570 [Flavisolibacter tropicus]
MLSNAFGNKTEQIQRNEFNAASSIYANQITTKSSVKSEWAFFDGVGAKGTGPELYQTVRSSTTFLVNVRQAIIDQYRKKGYSVFQVDFNEYVDDKYKQTYSRIEKLSPLYVGEYTNGSMRELAAPYQTGSNSNKKESNQSYDPTMYCFSAMAKVEKLIAAAKESGEEADWKKAINEYNLYMGGCGNSTGLLPESAAMKADIERYQQLKAIGQAFDKYTMFQFGYTGLDYKTDNVNDKQFQKIALQFSNRSSKYFHWLFEVAYVMNSPTYEVSYQNNNEVELKTETANRKGVMMSAGLGPTVGLFNDRMLLFTDAGLSLFLAGKDYTESSMGNIFLNVTPGVLFKLGSMGLGVTYEFHNNLSKDAPGDILQFYSSQGSTYTPKIVIKKPYKDWGSFGVRLVMNFVSRKN